MAWEDRLLNASFRGAPFEVLRTRDRGEHAVAEHEYPYRDGGEVEDMGRKARRISITAAVWGKDYETVLERLIKALDERGPAELVHPVFGSTKAQALPWDITHDAERRNYAELALEFVVAGTDNPFFSRAWPSAAAKTETARTGAAEVLSKAAAACKNPTAMGKAGLAALANLKSQATGVLTSGAEIVGAPATWANDIASLVTGIVDLRSFSSGSLLPDFSAVCAALSSAILLPSGSSSRGSSYYSGSGSGTGATTTPVTAGTELDQVAAHVQLEAALGVAEAAQIVLESEAVTPTLTPDEIETVTATTREGLQQSIDTYRDLYPLEQARAVTEPTKDVAAAVQEAAAAVLEARPPLTTVTVAARTCPRLLAHRLYGDHTRAAELVRLNRMSDPNFLTPGQELKVYAS
ncbi:DNA circularization protein [Humidesulfovibrio idahonensis]